jgi:hypothetical protein
MKVKNNDPGTRLAQEIIQFAKTNNLKIRKKNKPSSISTNNAVRK